MTVREEGWRGSTVLLGAEPGIPYGRLPLSKTYLRGEEDLTAWYVKSADWYCDHDVELRTVAECDAIRQVAKPGARAVAVGMGFIGSEVTASLHQMGLEVTTVLPGAAPLATILGNEVAAVLAAIHREHGVHLVTNDQVIGFEGGTRVERVLTSKGVQLACDLVIVGIGITPA